MIKEALTGGGLAAFAAFGLLVFVAVFVGVAFWAVTRRRAEVARWSSLPLADGAAPVEPHRKPQYQALAVVSAESSGGCGKCENCSCSRS